MVRTPDPPPEAGPSKPPTNQAANPSFSDSDPESDPTDAEWSDEEFEVGEYSSSGNRRVAQLLTRSDAIKWAKYMDSRRTRPDGWKGWHYGVMVSAPLSRDR